MNHTDMEQRAIIALATAGNMKPASAAMILARLDGMGYKLEDSTKVRDGQSALRTLAIVVEQACEKLGHPVRVTQDMQLKPPQKLNVKLDEATGDFVFSTERTDGSAVVVNPIAANAAPG